MYRRSGTYVLLAGAFLALLLLWLPVRYFTGYSIGRDHVSKIYLPCGTALGILTDQFDPAVTRPGERNECTKRARGRIVYVVVFVGPLLVLGMYGVLRGPHPYLPLRQ